MTDYGYMKAILQVYWVKGFRKLVHGDARGADQLAGRAGTDLGYEVAPVPARWTEFGTAAGPIRNNAMLHIHAPSTVIGFPIGDSRGTHHMLRTAHSAGLATKSYTFPEGMRDDN